MQSLSHYSPWNCSSLYFFSSSTYFDVLSLRYPELCGQCACVLSHLMIPAWATRRKSHSSLSKSTSKKAHSDWNPLQLPPPNNSRCRNKRFYIFIIASGECLKEKRNCKRCDEDTEVDCLNEGLHKPGGWKGGTPCCEGCAHTEWVITWDRCLLDLSHRTRADVPPFHAP